MLLLACDADIPGSLVRAIRRLWPVLDLIRVQDVGLREADDDAILEWAAAVGRVIISRDRKTLIAAANDRVKFGRAMPGLIMPGPSMTHRQAADEIAMVALCFEPAEIRDRVLYLPL